MSLLHGYLEFRQLGEWYGVVNAGLLLVPSTRLTSELMAAASDMGLLNAPCERSVAFEEMWFPVRESVSATATVAFSEQEELVRRLADVDPDLVTSTNLDLLGKLGESLAGRFGRENVRLVLFAD